MNASNYTVEPRPMIFENNESKTAILSNRHFCPGLSARVQSQKGIWTEPTLTSLILSIISKVHSAHQDDMVLSSAI